MSLEILRCRVTLLWSWSAAAFLPAKAGPAPWWAGDVGAYIQTFDALRDGTSAAAWPVTMPWKGGTRQRYWSYCAAESGEEPKHQRDIDSGTAWRNLVPFRATGPLPGLEGPPGVDAWLEALLFPAGVAVLLNLDIQANLPIDALVDAIAKLAIEPAYATTKAAACTATQLRDEARTAMSQALGVPTLSSAFGAEDPYGLVTVTRADGAEVLAAEGPPADLHRALHGLASRSSTWRHNPVPIWLSRVMPQGASHPLGQACLTAKERGLVMWHPQAIGSSAGSKERAALNCRHRNLSFGMAQVQCLTRFLRVVAQQRQGQGLSASAEGLAKRACVLLSRLYGRAAYHSWALRQWIDEDGDAVAIINAERTLRGWNPLN